MATSLDGSVVTTYCDPIDVCKAIRLIDYYSSDNGIMQPTDSNLPGHDELCERIVVAENFIDRYTNNSWKEHRATTGVVDINTYWQDLNGRRNAYWARGGNFVQLHKDVCPWDPEKGDKIEFRTLGDRWVTRNVIHKDQENIEHDLDKGVGPNNAHFMPYPNIWFDYKGGRMFVRQGLFEPTENAIRVTYRWGNVHEPVPPEIKRATALKVGLTLMNEELYLTKLGTGGDLGGAKSDMKRGMQDEINEIIMMHRRFTNVYSPME